MSSYLIVSFRVSVTLKIFCVENLSIDLSGALKSSAIIVFPINFSFYVHICCVYLGATILGDYILTSVLSCSLVFVCLFAISWTAPAAYGGSQARGQIGAIAADLCQSHSNTGSKPHVQPATQLMAMLDP